MADVDSIHSYWFRGFNDLDLIDQNSSKVQWWFKKDDAIDSEIRDLFEEDYKKASTGQYKDWEESARGQLASIILFDQFPRNMYRNTPQMFETDSRARRLTLRSIAEKKDTRLQLIERLFIYMPLMHAEDLTIQELSLQCFESLVIQSQEVNSRNTPYYENNFGYAKRHHETIERFGRFPHRNSILGRSSSSQEFEFLKKPGSSF